MSEYPQAGDRIVHSRHAGPRARTDLTLPILKVICIGVCTAIILIIQKFSLNRPAVAMKYDGKYYISHTPPAGYMTYPLVLSIVCVIITCILLTMFTLRIHSTIMPTLPWNMIENTFDDISALLYAIAFALLIWQCATNRYVASYQHETFPYHYAVVCALCGVNFILYLFSACHSENYIV